MLRSGVCTCVIYARGILNCALQFYDKQTIIDTWSLLLMVPDDCRLYNSHNQENQHCCNCNSCHCQSRLYTDNTVITWPLPNKTLVYLCSQNTQHHLPHSPATRLATDWGSSRLESHDGSSAQYGTVLTGLLNGSIFWLAPTTATWNVYTQFGLRPETVWTVPLVVTFCTAPPHRDWYCKVLWDCFTSIKALNLTPGDSYSGGVYWSDHHQLWSSCTSKKEYKSRYVTVLCGITMQNFVNKFMHLESNYSLATS